MNRPSTTVPDSGADTASPSNHWTAVVSIAFATFLVVAAEMMPVGLLSGMSSTLTVSNGTIGLSLTITGVVAAITAPVVPAAVRRLDRRTALVALTLLVAVANAVTALAPNFATLAGARVLLGIGMGGVWALAVSLGRRLVAERSGATATAIVISGVSVASVLGVPAGVLAGSAFGWRAAFLGLAGIGVLTAAGIWAAVPRLPAGPVLAPRGVARLVRHPGVTSGLALMALMVLAHFAAYTYVRPAFETLSGAGPGLVGTLLLIYGLGGVAGNFAAGWATARTTRGTVAVLSAGLALAMAGLPLLGGGVVGTAICMVLWGLSYGGTSVATLSWLAAAAPRHTEVVGAVGVGVFNASIALGALLGGTVVDRIGVQTVLYGAAAISLVAVVVALLTRPTGRRAAPVGGP